MAWKGRSRHGAWGSIARALPSRARLTGHWFERVLLPAALAFAGRWLDASSVPDTIVSINGDVIIEETGGDRTRQALQQGLAGVAGTVTGILAETAPREATVTLPRNTELAVVFLHAGAAGR